MTAISGARPGARREVAEAYIDSNITVPQTPEEKLLDLEALITGLPEGSFKNNASNRKNAFSNKIYAIIESLAVADMETDPAVQDELYDEAIDKLENDIRAKMDGCGLSADKNDWIIECTAQGDLNLLIDEIVADIVDLKNSN